jgi:hypothetical protein
MPHGNSAIFLPTNAPSPGVPPRLALGQVEHALFHQQLNNNAWMTRVERIEQARLEDTLPHGDEARHPDRADVSVVERGHPPLHRIDSTFHVGDAGE